MTEDLQSSPTPTALDALSSLTGDTTGTTTFVRYRWQTKQAVLLWLTCLRTDDAPIAIACEQVEDLVIVHADRLRCVQLKTRDRGSWSAKSLCEPGHGLDSLVRTYKLLRTASLHTIATLELWLEGPMSSKKDTVDFFADPTSADADVRRKLVALGLPVRQVSDFLKRLSLHPNQPSRTHIDAVVGMAIGALWPALSTHERNGIFGQLLELATSAQENSGTPLSMVAYRQLADVPASGDPVDARILTADALRAATPPTPNESRESILRRISAGTPATALEVKLTAAGASERTIAEAKLVRADAEVHRQLAVNGRPEGVTDFEGLSTRILSFAEALALLANQQSASNPAIAAHQADFIYAQLMSQPANVQATDAQNLFGGDARLLVGYLCQLSDECRFWWGHP